MAGEGSLASATSTTGNVAEVKAISFLNKISKAPRINRVQAEFSLKPSRNIHARDCSRPLSPACYRHRLFDGTAPNTGRLYRVAAERALKIHLNVT